MALIQVSDHDLLKAVERMGPERFDAFLEQALTLHKAPRAKTLSTQETRLFERINREVPDEVSSRYEKLLRVRKRRTLTEAERTELIGLAEKYEDRDADRVAALVELSQLRRVPFRALVRQLGIEPGLPNG